MTLRQKVCVVSVVTLALVGAAVPMAQDVKYNAMPNTDFAKYKTYKWVPVEGATKPDQITDQMIIQAIDSELSKKGLLKVTTETADLFVGYQAAVGHQTEWNAYNTGGMAWGWGGGMGTATESTISTGTLGVDIYDREAKQLVWRGSASKTIDNLNSAEKKQKTINQAVEKLLKNFPPPVKK